MITEGCGWFPFVSPYDRVISFTRNLYLRVKRASGGNVVYIAAGMCGNYKAKKNDSGKQPLFQRTFYFSVFHLPLLPTNLRFVQGVFIKMDLF